MKTKTLALMFALVMVLSMSVGVFAQDFTETWDENTVLTVFSDVDMVFPDMFADIDSDFLFVEPDVVAVPNTFRMDEGESEYRGKAVVKPSLSKAKFEYDPCGDGLIKFDATLVRHNEGGTGSVQDYYFGAKNTVYIRDITAKLIVETVGGTKEYDLDLKKCDSTGGDECHSVTFRKNSRAADPEYPYEAHLKGYLIVPASVVMNDVVDYKVEMTIKTSTYMTALWPVDNTQGSKKDTQEFTIDATAVTKTKKNYCQTSLEQYDGLGYSIRAKYDQHTGEARLQVVIRNIQPDLKQKNYIIPAEVLAFLPDNWDGNDYDLNLFSGAYTTNRNTNYVCKYTSYNVANAAPRTDYCKYGQGIYIAPHGMVRIDITLDHLSGAILRAADEGNVPFYLRLGGLYHPIRGVFEPVDFPCPIVSRLEVKDPLFPFMTFFKYLSDPAIKPSGAYGVYEGGLWGMYQKCRCYAYMAVRLNNDGIRDEIIDLNKTAVAINGGTPMGWKWVLTTIEPEKGHKIVLPAGEEVILFGRAKVTSIPMQMNSDQAITGAVNFTDHGLYITGKVFSDHNNTNCVAAPK